MFYTTPLHPEKSVGKGKGIKVVFVVKKGLCFVSVYTYTVKKREAQQFDSVHSQKRIVIVYAYPIGSVLLFRNNGFGFEYIRLKEPTDFKGIPVLCNSADAKTALENRIVPRARSFVPFLTQQWRVLGTVRYAVLGSWNGPLNIARPLTGTV